MERYAECRRGACRPEALPYDLPEHGDIDEVCPANTLA